MNDSLATFKFTHEEDYWQLDSDGNAIANAIH